MYSELREVTEYFGEEFAPADASRLLRTVRDFVVLFEKGMADIKVRNTERERKAGTEGGRGWQRVCLSCVVWPCSVLGTARISTPHMLDRGANMSGVACPLP